MLFRSQNYGFGTIEASYEIDSLDLISVSFGGNLGGQNYKSRGHSIIENMFNDTTVWYNSGDVNKSFWSGMSLSANYQGSFKKPQQLFTLSYQWDMSPNSQETFSRVDGVRNYASSYRKNLSRANGNEHTFQVDYVEVLENAESNKLGLTEYVANGLITEEEYKKECMKKWNDSHTCAYKCPPISVSTQKWKTVDGYHTL